MNYRISHRQFSALTLLVVVLSNIAFFPHFGRPQFRYTGVDINRSVWNLGLLATCIFDPACPPHFFVSPFAIVFPIIMPAIVVATYLIIVLNNMMIGDNR